MRLPLAAASAFKSHPLLLVCFNETCSTTGSVRTTVCSAGYCTHAGAVAVSILVWLGTRSSMDSVARMWQLTLTARSSLSSSAFLQNLFGLVSLFFFRASAAAAKFQPL